MQIFGKIRNILLAAAVFLLVFTTKSLAAGPGINLGAQRNLEGASQLVSPNGWVVMMATPGDCSLIEQAANMDINVIIRGHYPGQNYSGEHARNWAISWAYTLANMRGKHIIYFVPLNEPNQENSGDYQDPAVVVAYVNQLNNWFNKIGVRNVKVKLLSPALNTTHPNLTRYLNQASLKSIFSKVDGLAANWYSPNENFRTGNNEDPARFIRAVYGSGKPLYLTETGYHPGGGKVTYEDDKIAAVVRTAAANSGIKMFAVFSYDPLAPGKWNLFSAGQTVSAYKALKGRGQPPEGAGDLKKSTDQLKQEAKDKYNIELVSCADSCGLAVSESYCTTFAGPGNMAQARIQEETNDLAFSVSDPVRLLQEEKLADQETGPRKVTRGAFFERFNGLSLPYVKDLALFFGGDLMFNGDSGRASVLTKLMSSQRQDQLRSQYWGNCANGTYCNGQNSSPDRCPNQADECSIVIESGEAIPITRIPPKPLRKDFKTDLEWAQAMDVWEKKDYAKYWPQIPLFANPTTLVKDAVSIGACPAFNETGSTVSIRVPWVSALLQMSKELKGIFALGGKGIMMSRLKKAGPAKLASSQLFSPSGDKGQEEEPADTKPAFLAQANNQSSCSNIWWKSVSFKPAGPGRVCWVLSVGVNDPNYNLADWGFELKVYRKIKNAKGEVVRREMVGGASVPLLPGAANMWYQGPNAPPVTLDCNMVGTGPINIGNAKISDLESSFRITNGVYKGTRSECNPKNLPGFGQRAEGEECSPPFAPLQYDEADPEALPVEIDGHIRMRGPTKTLKCKSWSIETKTIDGQPVDFFKCEDPKGLVSYRVDDPVWLYVKYPFLNSISRNLVGPRSGALRFFTNNNKLPINWFLAGTSGLNYCVTVYDNALRNEFLAQGSSPAEVSRFKTSVIHNASLAPYSFGGSQTNFFSGGNQAQCALNKQTENLKVYPEKIGGVMKAVNDVKDCLVGCLDGGDCSLGCKIPE
ncbi:MAG: hypothetical protein GXP43_01640 [bacterium]|nr:hypothetical protein [bacterium]